MRTTWGKFLVTTTATLAVAGLAACSGTDADADADSGDGAAAEGGDPTEAFLASYADGVELMTAETSAFTMSMDMGDLGSTDATGVIDYTQDPFAMQMTMEVPGAGAVDMIVLDGGIYMNMGDASGGSYIYMSADDPSLEGAFDTATMDPIAQLESFTEAVESVEEVGTEDLNGVETTQYAVTVDGASLAESAGQAADAMPETITYDIWLDAEGRTHQMTFVLEDPTEISTTMTFSDFGEAASIEEPPADQVVDMSEMNAG